MRATALVSFFQQRGWTKHTLDFCHLKIQEILFFFHDASGNWNNWELEWTDSWSMSNGNSSDSVLCFQYWAVAFETSQVLLPVAGAVLTIFVAVHRSLDEGVRSVRIYCIFFNEVFERTRSRCDVLHSASHFPPCVFCLPQKTAILLRHLRATLDGLQLLPRPVDQPRAGSQFLSVKHQTPQYHLTLCRSGLQIWNRSPAPWRIRFWMCFLSVWMSTLSP